MNQNKKAAFDKAVEAAKKIPDPFDRSQVLADIAVKMAMNDIDPMPTFIEAYNALSAMPASPQQAYAEWALDEIADCAWALRPAVKPAPAPTPPPVEKWWKRWLRSLLKWGGLLTAVSGAMIVFGWTILAYEFGLWIESIGSLLLGGVVMAGLVPVELVTSIGDLFLGKRNRLDEKTRSIRNTLIVAIGSLAVFAVPAHFAALPGATYFPLFVVLLACSLGGTAAFEKAYDTWIPEIRRNRRTIGYLLTTVVAAIVVVLIYGALWNLLKVKADGDTSVWWKPTLDAMLLRGALMTVVAVIVLFAAWKVFRKLADHDHLLSGILVSALILLLGTKAVLVAKKIDVNPAPPTAPAGQTAEADPKLQESQKALDKQKQDAAAAAANPSSPTTTTTGTAPEAVKAPPSPPKVTGKAPEANDTLAKLRQKEKENKALLAKWKKDPKAVEAAGHLVDLSKQEQDMGHQSHVNQDAIAAEQDPDKKAQLEADQKALEAQQTVLADQLGLAKVIPGLEKDLKDVQDQIVKLQGQKPSASSAHQPTTTQVAEEGEQEATEKPKLSEKAKAMCRRMPESIRNDPNSICRGVI